MLKLIINSEDDCIRNFIFHANFASQIEQKDRMLNAPLWELFYRYEKRI